MSYKQGFEGIRVVSYLLAIDFYKNSVWRAIPIISNRLCPFAMSPIMTINKINTHGETRHERQNYW